MIKKKYVNGFVAIFLSLLLIANSLFVPTSLAVENNEEAIDEISTEQQIGVNDGSQSMDSDESGRQTESDFNGNSSNDDSSNIESKSTFDAQEVSVQSDNQWTSADFTYTTLEQTLNGCDYQREFVISGPAISGFSDSGEIKLANNKELVIPSRDSDGNLLVGIADGAFKEKGLTSVTFPTGMKVDYDDTITHNVTRRGNFIIGASAFMKNELTNVYIPDGIIAVMSNAFYMNKLKSVSLPRTIWWIENQSFARNEIVNVNFPSTCDFQVEMHGMTFASNQIKSVRIPDYCAVINKNTFTLNPGMEEVPVDAPEKEKSLGGVVYMYTDNVGLRSLDRIHHIEKTTASQKSYHQKIIDTGGYTSDISWTIADFTVDGTTVTGLSARGVEKKKVNKNIVIPDFTADYKEISAIGAGQAGGISAFGSAENPIESVEIPSTVTNIGNFAFANCGLKDVSLPNKLENIGVSAFSNNSLQSVILPDTVTTVGGGAFATNPTLERISISKSMTKIDSGVFGCSDAKNWMTNLTEIVIPDNITEIARNAFAGNNFSSIEIPGSVKTIGSMAFSTKNYLKTPFTLKLNEGLETIGTYAFRNKIIDEVELPSTVTKLPVNVFTKEYSDTTTPIITKVYVSTKAQYDDKTNFPASSYHTLYLTLDSVWTAEDFTYETVGADGSATTPVDIYPASNTADKITLANYVVSGLSEQGAKKLENNKNLVIPATDPSDKQVCGVGTKAFYNLGLESVTFPENVKTPYSGTWDQNISERGNFVIYSNSFANNKIKTLDLPEGVIYVGGTAFQSNQLVSVKFPETIMSIANQAFARNQIKTIGFPETCDFKLNIDRMAFAVNQIQSVQLPKRVEKVTNQAFFQNTGKEPVTSGTTQEQKGGIVYMYCDNADVTNEAYIDSTTNGKSNTQKLIVGVAPSDETPWGIDDFTYSDDKLSITGLSASGQSKIKVNPDLILPIKNSEGNNITGIGAGVAGAGVFTVKDGSTTYSPSSIILPSDLQTIGNFAFAASKFETITLPETVTSLGNAVFQGSALISITLPDSITTLGNGVFASSAALKSAKLPTGITSVPDATFSMTALETIDIPEGVTSVGRNAFAGCGATSITLPSTLTTIGNSAFLNHQASEIEIPASVTSIGTSAFRVFQEGKAKMPNKLILHEGLTSIPSHAFAGSNIESVELPSTVTTLNKDAFKDSANPVVIRTSQKDKLEGSSDIVIEGTAHNVIYDVQAMTGWEYEDFTINGTAITGYSVSGEAKRKTLDKLVLPTTSSKPMPEASNISTQANDSTSITAIADNAFRIPDDEITQLKDSVSSPNGMTDIVLPETLQTIGSYAFQYQNFTNIEMPNSLTSIGECSFKGNKLTSVSLPDSVTTLGNGAFSMNDITNLRLSNALTVIPNGAFSMNIRMEHVDLPEGITEIQEMAFAGARLTDLTIPTSVTKIDRKAFHLHHLSSLTIPGNVKEIGESAFEGTYKFQSLVNLKLEEGIESIGKYAFKEGHLTSTTLPNSLVALGEEPFLNNDGTDGDNVVVLHTLNKDHLNFAKGNSYVIQYDGGEPITPVDPVDPSNPGGETGGSTDPLNPDTGNGNDNISQVDNELTSQGGVSTTSSVAKTGDEIPFVVIGLALVSLLAGCIAARRLLAKS